MFVGHFGVGFAGKKVDNKPSLGTLFFASQFLDLIWPVFILTGIEKVEIEPGLMAANPLDFTYYPFSHSLLLAIVWGTIFGIIYFLIRKNIKGSILLGSLVVSHWILDLIVHRPDLPILPWGNLKVGFGLWNSLPLSVIVELFIFALGAYFYLSATKPKNKKGSYAFGGLIIFLVLIYTANILGSPPPSVEAIGFAGLSQWLIVAWAYWISKNRYSINEKLTEEKETGNVESKPA
jgi:hypothetical protein